MNNKKYEITSHIWYVTWYIIKNDGNGIVYKWTQPNILQREIDLLRPFISLDVWSFYAFLLSRVWFIILYNVIRLHCSMIGMKIGSNCQVHSITSPRTIEMCYAVCIRIKNISNFHFNVNNFCLYVFILIHTT